MADGKLEQDAKWAQQHWVSNISSEIPIFQGFLALLPLQRKESLYGQSNTFLRVCPSTLLLTECQGKFTSDLAGGQRLSGISVFH